MRITTTAAALALALGSLAAQAGPEAPRDRLALTASASTEVSRDLLSLTFATTREGSDAATVQAGLKQALDAALTEARKVARPGQVDLQTGNFSLTPRYAPKTGQISGWQGTAEPHRRGPGHGRDRAAGRRITTLSIARVGYGLSREARERVEARSRAGDCGLPRQGAGLRPPVRLRRLCAG
jgi:predicted secreted protein